MITNNKRKFGLFLILAGMFLILFQPLSSVTGFSIANEALNILNGVWFWLAGMGMILIGSVLMAGENNEQYRVGEYRKNLKLILENNLERLAQVDPTNKFLRGHYETRIKSILNAPLRREKLDSQLPSEANQIPNLGILPRGIGYRPFEAKKEMLKLRLYHYVSDPKAVDRIKSFYLSGRENVILGADNGWAYFVDSPFPSDLENPKQIRNVLGLTDPDLSKKKKIDPNKIYYIKLDVNIPKERVWIAPESTNLNGNRYDITKYAIAGGIKKEDIQGTIYTSRYKTKELKKRPKIEVLR